MDNSFWDLDIVCFFFKKSFRNPLSFDCSSSLLLQNKQFLSFPIAFLRNSLVIVTHAPGLNDSQAVESLTALAWLLLCWCFDLSKWCVHQLINFYYLLTEFLSVAYPSDKHPIFDFSCKLNHLLYFNGCSVRAPFCMFLCESNHIFLIVDHVFWHQI